MALGHEVNSAAQLSAAAAGSEASPSKRPSDTPLPLQSGASRSESVPHYEYARASPQLESPVDRVVYVPVPQGKVLGASIENGPPQEFATVQQLADVQ